MCGQPWSGDKMLNSELKGNGCFETWAILFTQFRLCLSEVDTISPPSWCLCLGVKDMRYI